MDFWKKIKELFLGEAEGDYYPLTKPRTEELESKPVKKNVRVKTKRNTAPRKKTGKKKKVKKS